VVRLIRTARTTGLFYLGLAITGVLGFLLVRPRLFDKSDPEATLANLIEHERLARLGIALELGIVVTQALTAVWFYRLFRSVDNFAAGALAAFGMVNAVVILVSAAFLATALEVALEPAADAAASTQLMYIVSGNLWGVGALFFGLWLIPMGWLVLRSGWMPRPLGWVLIAGGVGYFVSAFVDYLAPDVPVVAEALTVPASVGEFWMIGYLLIRGVNRRALAGTHADASLEPGAVTPHR
jgi:Domain of unknown function (DUF4386)